MSKAAVAKVMEHAKIGLLAREAFFEEHAETLVAVGRAMAVSLAKGGKLLFCGNGGSAADSQHLAAEFVNRFQLERPPLPAISLTTDTSILTAIGNDYGFEQIFTKQVQALGKAGDVFVGISTSGSSPNVIQALREARRKGLVCIGLCGSNGDAMAESCHWVITVPHPVTAIVQEVHIAAGHMLCHLVDHFLFEAVMELDPYLSEEGR